MKENLAVIFGGKSSEHDVSIVSAMQAIQFVDTDFYNIIPVYIAKNGNWYSDKKLKNFENFENLNLKGLKQVTFVAGDNCLFSKFGSGFKKFKKIDCALIVLHGMNGEDGKVMSMLSMCNIPYSSADPTESGVCLDKSIFKTYANGLNINTVKGKTYFDYEFKNNPENVLDDICENFDFPVIVKPATQGSSIGITVAKNKQELEDGLILSFELTEKTLVEEFLNNITEINVALLKDDNEIVVSELEQPIKNSDILSFENKYVNSTKSLESVSRIIPAKVDKNVKSEIINTAKLLFKNLNLKGVVRFDFIISENKVYLNEVNTIPGSLAFYLFKPLNIKYNGLINLLIKNAYENYNNLKSKNYIFNSSILKNGILGVKK